MGSFWVEVGILMLLILANGVFSMSEIAVVSARKIRLQHRAQRGDAKASAALRLAGSPGDFLATVQVGITLVGVFTGAFGGATMAGHLAKPLGRLEFVGHYADAVALGIVVVIITYLSLIIGELVPKRVGLSNPETIAGLVARPMYLLSRLAAPVVHLLSASTNAVMRLLRIPESEEPAVTEDEIKLLLRQGTRAGAFEQTELVMVESIFRLADWRVGAVMTPRTDIEWLDPKDSREELVAAIERGGHSHYPVAEGSLDSIIGVVHAKDLLTQSMAGKPVDLIAMAKAPLYVPESMRVFKLIEIFRNTHNSIALVVDEYGSLEGMVTIADVLQAIVRDLPGTPGGEDQMAVQREDGSWLIDGSLPVDQFKDMFAIDELPEEDSAYYQTLGGLVMMQLGHIPVAGEYFDWQGLRVEVMDMDGRRVDKVLVARLPEEGETAPQDDDSAQ